MKRWVFVLMVIGMGISGCAGAGRGLPEEPRPFEEERPGKDEENPGEREEAKASIEDRILSYIKNMTINEKIGQLLMPAFRSHQYGEDVLVFTEDMKNIVEEYKLGGVILFKENIKDKEQVKSLIDDLQEASHLPLWMGVDEEGGLVSRISSNPEMGFKEIPLAFDIGKKGNREEAYEIGRDLGLMLKELGFNMDFAPVADIWSNPKNKVIGKRSFGNDPHQVSEMVDEVVRGLQEQEIVSVIKHFPGHGDTSEDTHTGRALVNRTREELFQRELIPFESAIDQDVGGIMVAHVELAQIDAGLPASLSYKIMTEILKDQMGFKGLIITDALDMQAVTNEFSAGEVAVKSFMAGADILLMPNIREAYAHLLKANEDGLITDERLEESLYKILSTKYKYGIIEGETFSLTK